LRGSFVRSVDRPTAYDPLLSSLRLNERQLCSVMQIWVLRTLCDGAKLRRLATTPGGAGLIPAGVRFGAVPSLPPLLPNKTTGRLRASTPGLPTWWFDFLQAEGRRRPSHKVRKTRLRFGLRLEWVSWFIHNPLLEPIGHIPPAEAEANCDRQITEQAMLV
jgi:hypothetical protein